MSQIRYTLILPQQSFSYDIDIQNNNNKNNKINVTAYIFNSPTATKYSF